MEIKNIGQLIQHLATKAGVLATDPNLVNLLSNAELTKVPLHSDLVKALDENLLSVDAATDNHPVIGPKYKAQALNAVDKKLEAIMEELGLDDASKAELKGIKSSYDRLQKLGEITKGLITKKNEAAPGKEKDALQKQIDELLSQMQTEKASYEQKVQSVEDLRLQDRIGFEKKGLYAGLKTIYDSLDAGIKTASIDAIINKALQDKDAKFTYDDKGNFIVIKNDGTNLVGANHTKYTPQILIDEILAQNKILAVNNQQQQQQNNDQQQQQQRRVDTLGQQISGTNQTVANLNMEALNALSDQN